MKMNNAKTGKARTAPAIQEDLESTGPIVGSGDFLADMGYANSDEMYLKFALAHAIGQIVREQRLTQIQVEELTGVPQSNVSRIVRGRVSGFSVEKLLDMLRSLGKDIEITVRDHNVRAETRGTIKVVFEAESAAA